MGLNVNIMVQEYIKESEGSDLRCFVLGDRVIAAMKRQGAPGEFRSNLHRGGMAMAIELTDELAGLAVRASETLGLRAAGVDVLMSSRGPLIGEVNASPGLHGIQSTHSEDLARRYVEVALSAAQPSH